MSDLKHSNPKEQLLPISILAAGRPCLVVGGGRVGLRKVLGLLDAGVTVTVVSPDLHPELAELVNLPQAAVTHIDRTFQTDDVDGFFLVYAATSDRSVNAEVRDACRQRNILVCSTDRNWRKGDFVTPATVRRENLTVAVSSGGRSCRRSRLIKNSLGRHLSMIDSADLLVIGISHDSLSVQERGGFQLAGERLQQVGRLLMQVWGIHEFMLLSTCNRVELHAVASRAQAVIELAVRALQLDALAAGRFYVKGGYDAFRHSTLLAAGLLSQVPGEKHIVAQLKNALAQALEQAWAGSMIQHWQSAALHISKAIRHHTEGGLRQAEIEDLCIDYLVSNKNWQSDRPVVIIGSGSVGRALCRQFADRVSQVVWCYHQRRPRVPDNAKARVRLCPLSELRSELRQAGAVVCAASATQYLIGPADIAVLRENALCRIVDLAVPPNVDPQLRHLGENITLADLDDLRQWYGQRTADTAGIVQTGIRITDEHSDLYGQLIDSFQGGNPGQ
jgi:glutamyl-tRNA reductase